MFACAAHSNEANKYVLIEREGDRTLSRTQYRASQKEELKAKLRDDAFRGVEILDDVRDDERLLPRVAPATSKAIDYERIFRAKSDEELTSLET